MFIDFSTAAPQILEESVVPEKDRAEADRIRNSTKAPSSGLSKFGDELMDAYNNPKGATSCNGAGGCDFVIVSFDVTAGFSTEGVDRRFSMSSVDTATGRIEASADGTSVAIHKGMNASVAGYYLWNATWKNGSKGCAGKVYISGTKPTVRLSVYSNNCSSQHVDEI